ncbi:MAG TPA: histidine kinase [Chitinophagaceae bacterium]|nr:histidine kinase [Chitinophagaceae bacterium]
MSYSKIIVGAIFFILLLGSNNPSWAQEDMFTRENNIIDSAINELNLHPSKDTTRVYILAKIFGTPIFLSGKKKVLPYLYEADSISHQLNFKTGLLYCMDFRAGIAKSSQQYDLAMKTWDSITHTKLDMSHPKNKRFKEFAYKGLGNIYRIQEKEVQALQAYVEAYKLTGYELNKNNIDLVGNIGDLYLKLEYPEKALGYCQKYLAYTQKETNIGKILNGYSLLTSCYLGMKQYDAAEKILQQTDAWDYRNMNATGYNPTSLYLCKSLILSNKHQYAQALKILDTALTYAPKDHLPIEHFRVKDAIVKLYLAKGDLPIAKQENDNLQKLQQSLSLTQGKENVDENYAEYYKKNGEAAKALAFLENENRQRDSLVRVNNLQQTEQLTTKFETEIKDHEIRQLKMERQQKELVSQKNKFIYILLLCITLGLLLLSYFVYLNNQKKLRLRNQQITELEQEKKLRAVDALLQGQEEERERIAQELHDGLGGMLSGVKMSFSHMKENLVMTPENMEAFQHSIQQLDQTLDELRKVSHNLMPDVLVRFGLIDAIQEFCQNIERSSKVNVSFQFLGTQRTLSNSTQLSIYRILQELINNAIKHGECQHILAQISMEENKILLTVEDDGKGFDQQTLQQTKGMGMSSVQHRVDYLKGGMQIEAKPNEGVVINIELNV